ALIQGGWRTCGNPGDLLDCLGQPLSVRRARLFSIACCRRAWDLLTYKDCRNAILLAERLDVGEADPDEVRKVRAEMKAKWVATRTRMHSGWRGRIRRGFLGLVDRILRDPQTPAEPDNAAPLWLWKPQADARLWAHDRNVKYYHRELAAQ